LRLWTDEREYLDLLYGQLQRLSRHTSDSSNLNPTDATIQQLFPFTHHRHPQATNLHLDFQADTS